MPAKKGRNASIMKGLDAPPPLSASEEVPAEVPVEAAQRSPTPPHRKSFRICQPTRGPEYLLIYTQSCCKRGDFAQIVALNRRRS